MGGVGGGGVRVGGVRGGFGVSGGGGGGGVDFGIFFNQFIINH